MAGMAAGAGGAATERAGSRTVNALPSPRPALDTVTVPPCSSTSRCTSDKPMPSPPRARSRLRDTCVNMSNTDARWSAGMPMPLSASVISMLSPQRRPDSCRRPPGGVYLMAFDSRLPSTCARRTGSASNATGSGGRVEDDRVARRFQRRRVRFERVGQHLAQVDPFHLQHHLAVVDAGDVEQVVDQVDHVRDLPLHHGAHAGRGHRVVGADAQHVDAVADRRERIAQFVRQHGEELRLAAVGFAQRFHRAHPLDVGPAALDDGFHQRHLARPPGARHVLVHGHHRHQLAPLDQRAADDRLDADRIEHGGAFVARNFAVEVGDAQGLAAAHRGAGARAEQVERIHAHRGKGAGRGPVVADREAVIVRLQVGVGDSRDVQVFAQHARGHCHDRLRCGRDPRGFADGVEQAQALFHAFSLGDVGAGGGDVDDAPGIVEHRCDGRLADPLLSRDGTVRQLVVRGRPRQRLGQRAAQHGDRGRRGRPPAAFP